MNDGNKEDEYEDDDSNDSDYSVEGDDIGLYDSNLDEIDELLHLKETVDQIHQGAPQLFQSLSQFLSPDELNRFAESLNHAQELKDREERCTKAIEEMEKKMKQDH